MLRGQWYMKTNKRVSIVVPNYNGIAFMEACLKAVEQDAPEAEVLVVDNGSSDGSRELVEEKFQGSLPAFVAAFTRRRDISEEELDEVQRMIDRIRKGG